jgi:phospholipid/cholesterol/gamma-HCH transport system substrate-binding protein
MDPGSKVTCNGVEIGRVSSISEITRDGRPAATLVLGVTPEYVNLTSPKNPAAQSITPSTVIDATSVTTEFNTLFETLTSIAEKVEPVKVNPTLTAPAAAPTGLGDKFGATIVNADTVLDDVNPRMPQAHYDVQRLAAVRDTYADADVFGRGRPYLARGAADLAPTSQLLGEYSPEIFCTFRNYHDIAPKIYADLGNNGYSLGARSSGAIAGAPAPYMYPENLPPTNAKGGPGGRPGCWQRITRELWPAPYPAMDDGASIAPYNHLDVGSPLVVEYVWGRQLGDNTINP